MNSSEIKKLRQRNAVAILKKEGCSISAISKKIGISYKHAKQIYEQVEVDRAKNEYPLGYMQGRGAA